MTHSPDPSPELLTQKHSCRFDVFPWMSQTQCSKNKYVASPPHVFHCPQLREWHHLLAPPSHHWQRGLTLALTASSWARPSHSVRCSHSGLRQVFPTSLPTSTLHLEDATSAFRKQLRYDIPGILRNHCRFQSIDTSWKALGMAATCHPLHGIICPTLDFTSVPFTKMYCGVQET